MKTTQSALFAATLFASTLAAGASFSQPVCIPGTGCSIEIKPPPIQWTPPPVQGNGQVSVPSQPVDTGPMQWQMELDRRARWDAYFKWRAKVVLDAQASFEVRLRLDLKWKARLTPDPYAGKAPPSYGIPADVGGGGGGVGAGILGICFGYYAGPGYPYYIGYCPPVRIRFGQHFGIALDPAIVGSIHGSDPSLFGMVGLRPGVEITFLNGKRKRAGSRLYSVAGMDLWVPFESEGKAPAVFLGGHVGLGTVISWDGRFESGFEARGLVREGFGDQTNAVAREMSVFRTGVELRWILLGMSF